MDVKKTLLKLALAAAGVAAVSVAQAQPAPTTTAPPAPAPTTTADPNAPPPAPPAAPTAAPTVPPGAPTAAADPNAPPVTPPATPQGDPNAPPPPPPVAPPPVAPPPAAAAVPPPTPYVPPPAPAVNWNGNPQGNDTTTPTEKPKPLRWRGTLFNWYQYANTQYFGVGDPYIGQEDFSYAHLFRFVPNFYIVDEPKDKLTVSATLWGSVEATDSNLTTTKNEFELRDTTLGLKYTRSLLQSPNVEGTPPEYTTKVSLGTGVALPTSKASIAYRYLTWNIGPSVAQQVKLLGSKSDLLPNLNINLSLSYSHAFNRTNVPTSGNVNILRQTPTGDPLLSDQMGKYLLVTDNLIAGGALTLPVYKDLSVGLSYRYWMKWKPKTTDGCITLPTGCAQPAPNPNGAVTYFADTIFDASIGYNFFDVLDASIGYSNWTNAIGENGKRRNVLYSPDATFYLDLTANLDAIYSKATGRDKKAVAKGSSSSSWF